MCGYMFKEGERVIEQLEVVTKVTENCVNMKDQLQDIDSTSVLWDCRGLPCTQMPQNIDNTLAAMVCIGTSCTQTPKSIDNTPVARVYIGTPCT